MSMDLLTIGRAIASARSRRGLTITTTALDCGFTRKRLSEIENGKAKNLTILELVDLGRALDMDIDIKIGGFEQ